VKRVFAKLVEWDNGWGINIIVFDAATKTVEQITPGGGQDARYTDMRYTPSEKRLTFVIHQEIVEMPISEISVQVYDVMMRTENWKKLCHGLSIRSQKTWDWCIKRGIYG
jgi:hypothetical protein